jgi:hypothetical protein
LLAGHVLERRISRAKYFAFQALLAAGGLKNALIERESTAISSSISRFCDNPDIRSDRRDLGNAVQYHAYFQTLINTTP